MHPALLSLRASAHRRMRGFTLVEVMIVVTMLGIVTAIAIPSYADYTRKAARADAQMVLLQAANDLERIYLQCNSYTKLYNPNIAGPNPCEANTADIQKILSSKYPQIPVSGTKRYDLVVDLQDGAYTLKAVRSPGPQARDSCGDLVLQHTGQRELEDATGVTSTDCWRR
jgi:type IV pilus assembly protein PilE